MPEMALVMHIATQHNFYNDALRFLFRNRGNLKPETLIAVSYAKCLKNFRGECQAKHQFCPIYFISVKPCTFWLDYLSFNPITTLTKPTNPTDLSPTWVVFSCVATQELLSILWNPKVRYCVHKNLPLSLSWARSIQSIAPHPISLRSILILSHLRIGILSDLFPLTFPPISYMHPWSRPFVLHAIPISSKGDPFSVTWFTIVRIVFLFRTVSWNIRRNRLVYLLFLAYRAYTFPSVCSTYHFGTLISLIQYQEHMIASHVTHELASQQLFNDLLELCGRDGNVYKLLACRE
jgi:hypothetical protein